MTLNSDARLGRLTSANSAKATIVYALDASNGPLTVALHRLHPAISDGKCGLALAETPQGSQGTTYFVFDATPGTYYVGRPYSGHVDAGQPTFIVPAGKQVYIGEFASGTGFGRNIDAAKAALGPSAAGLELADMAEADRNYMVGFTCLP